MDHFFQKPLRLTCLPGLKWLLLVFRYFHTSRKTALTEQQAAGGNIPSVDHARQPPPRFLIPDFDFQVHGIFLIMPISIYSSSTSRCEFLLLGAMKDWTTKVCTAARRNQFYGFAAFYTGKYLCCSCLVPLISAMNDWNMVCGHRLPAAGIVIISNIRTYCIFIAIPIP